MLEHDNPSLFILSLIFPRKLSAVLWQNSLLLTLPATSFGTLLLHWCLSIKEGLSITSRCSGKEPALGTRTRHERAAEIDIEPTKRLDPAKVLTLVISIYLTSFLLFLFLMPLCGILILVYQVWPIEFKSRGFKLKKTRKELFTKVEKHKRENNKP